MDRPILGRPVPSLRLPYHLCQLALSMDLMRLEWLLRLRLNQAGSQTRRPGRGIVVEADESTCLEDLDACQDERIAPPAPRRILCILRRAGRSLPIFHAIQG
jgi:hypothetical protein